MSNYRKAMSKLITQDSALITAFCIYCSVVFGYNSQISDEWEVIRDV